MRDKDMPGLSVKATQGAQLDRGGPGCDDSFKVREAFQRRQTHHREHKRVTAIQ